MLATCVAAAAAAAARLEGAEEVVAEHGPIRPDKNWKARVSPPLAPSSKLVYVLPARLSVSTAGPPYPRLKGLLSRVLKWKIAQHSLHYFWI